MEARGIKYDISDYMPHKTAKRAAVSTTADTKPPPMAIATGTTFVYQPP